MSKKEKGIYGIMKRWHNLRVQLFFEGIVVGLLSGMLVVLFRILIEKAEFLRQKLYTLLQTSGPGAIALWFLVLLLIAFLLATIVQREPMASGSDIPQVKGVLLGQFQMDWLKLLVGKFIGGVLAIGAGLSLGRPSVQIGAAAGQGISRGDSEIIPRGDTMLYAGDYLIVLSNENQSSQEKDALLPLTGGENGH